LEGGKIRWAIVAHNMGGKKSHQVGLQNSKRREVLTGGEKDLERERPSDRINNLHEKAVPEVLMEGNGKLWAGLKRG